MMRRRTLFRLIGIQRVLVKYGLDDDAPSAADAIPVLSRPETA
jgi:hypothetical protein